MMRAGLSYSIPVSRLRDWLQQNRVPFPAKQTREVPVILLEKELPTRASLTPRTPFLLRSRPREAPPHN